MGKLVAQAFGGLFFMVLLLGAILFASAGSWNYWQAWVYLVVFFVCTLFVTLYLIRNDPALLERRVQAGPVAETRKSQQVIQSLASVFFIGIYIVAGLDYRFQWSNMSPALSLAGDVFVAAGLIFVFFVFRENSFAGATIQIANEQKVISTGPYALVRHPMYLGAMIFLVATPIALGSWVALPFPIPLMFVIVLRLLDEEKFLAKSLPGYPEYQRRVRYHLVPRVW